MESLASRIAELSAIITESHKDSSVESAAIWANAVKERSELISIQQKLDTMVSDFIAKGETEVSISRTPWSLGVAYRESAICRTFVPFMTWSAIGKVTKADL